MNRRPPPPPPANYSSPYFLVRIASIIDAGANKYGFQESWLIPDGTFADKTSGGRLADSANPAVALSGLTFAVNDYALARSADGAAGAAWELVSADGSGGGGGTGGNCFGDGWRIGLTEDDEWALRVLPLGSFIFIEPGATVTINGVEYTIDFDYTVPSLTLTPPSGSGDPIEGVLDCTGCPCFKFAFLRADFFPEEPIPAYPCSRVLYVNVCVSCPPGWYCARAKGSTGFYEPIELDAGEACNDTLDILGGPYADEATARAHCGETLSCSTGIDEGLGARNIFNMPIAGMVTCPQYNHPYRMRLGDSLPIPTGCQYDIISENGWDTPVARILKIPGTGATKMRLWISIGPYTWQYYYDEVALGIWDWRSSITFTFDAFLPSGSPFCDFPATITIYPV